MSIEIDATLAQLVEHLFCKQRVVGSNPTGGSNFLLGRFLKIQKNWKFEILNSKFETISNNRNTKFKTEMQSFRNAHPREGGGPELEYFRTGPPIGSGVGKKWVSGVGCMRDRNTVWNFRF